MAASALQQAPLIAFAGGGTGGHLYPAIAVAHALREMRSSLRFVFLVTEREVDRRILKPLNLDFVAQSLPSFSGRPWRWPGMVLKLRSASQAIRRRFVADPPAAVLGSGGMASVPGMRQARSLGIPTLILNPDALPGRANRFLSSTADSVFVQWEDAATALPGSRHVQVLGCPIRSDFRFADRDRGIRRFSLDPARKTLLITGASLGARTINEAVIRLAEQLQTHLEWQLLHLTGLEDEDRVRQAYQGRNMAATVLPYTEHMADALAAADLVISRAGASTLAEITALGKASILMPYPFHKDQHQVANAQCLVRRGAAILVLDQKDAALNAISLGPVVERLTRDGHARENMAMASARLGKGDAAQSIADDLLARIESRGAGTCESLERTCGLAR